MNRKISISRVISKQKDLILLSILFSIIFGLPHIIMISKNHDLYNPLPIENVGSFGIEEGIYVIGIRKVMDNNYMPLDAKLGLKDIPNNLELSSSILLGGFAKIFGLDIKSLVIIADFIFPTIIFLLYFYLCYKILKMNRSLSILVASLVTFFAHDIPLSELIKNAVLFNFKYFVDYRLGLGPLGITRIIHPEFTAILMLLGLIFLYLSFDKKGFYYPLIGGMMAAVVTYSYFYYFTFFWATFSVFALFLILYERRKETVVKAIIISATGLLFSIPYLAKIIAYNSLPYRNEILLKVGANFGRSPNLTPIIFALLIIFMLYLAIFDDKRKFFFLSSMAIAGSLLFNMQVITGYTVQEWHWAARILNPMYIVMIALIAQKLNEKFFSKKFNEFIIQKNLPKAISRFLKAKYLIYPPLIVIIILGIILQINFSLNNYENHKFLKEELEFYKWLNKNTKKDSIILTISNAQNTKIPVFTHNNVYLPNGFFGSLKTEETIDRMLFAYNMFNVSDEKLMQILSLPSNAAMDVYYNGFVHKKIKAGPEVFETYYFNPYLFSLQFKFSKERGYPNPDNQSLEGYYFPKKFRDFIMKKKISKDYNFYDYDYILVEDYSRAIGDTSKIEKNYKKVYSNDKFSLYAKN